MLIIAKNEIKHTRYLNLAETTFYVFFLFFYTNFFRKSAHFSMSPHNVYQLRYYSYLILKIKRRTDGKFNTDIKYNNCQGLFNFFIFQQYVYFILNLFPARVFKNIFLNLAQSKSIYNLFLSDENVFLSPKNYRKK